MPTVSHDVFLDLAIGNGTNADVALYGATTLKIGTEFLGGVYRFYRALLRFELLLPPDVSIEAATLSVNARGSVLAGSATITGYRVLQSDWTSGATWNTREGVATWSAPGLASPIDYTTTGPVGGFVSSPTDDLEISSGLVDMLNAARDGGYYTLEILLIGPEVAGGGVSNLFVGDSSFASPLGVFPDFKAVPFLQIAYQLADPAAGGNQLTATITPAMTGTIKLNPSV